MQTITATVKIEYEYKKDAYTVSESVGTLLDAVRADSELLGGTNNFFENERDFIEWLEDNELIVKIDVEVEAND